MPKLRSQAKLILMLAKEKADTEIKSCRVAERKADLVSRNAMDNYARGIEWYQDNLNNIVLELTNDVKE